MLKSGINLKDAAEGGSLLPWTVQRVKHVSNPTSGRAFSPQRGIPRTLCAPSRFQLSSPQLLTTFVFQFFKDHSAGFGRWLKSRRCLLSRIPLISTDTHYENTVGASALRKHSQMTYDDLVYSYLFYKRQAHTLFSSLVLCAPRGSRAQCQVLDQARSGVLMSLGIFANKGRSWWADNVFVKTSVSSYHKYPWSITNYEGQRGPLWKCLFVRINFPLPLKCVKCQAAKLFFFIIFCWGPKLREFLSFPRSAWWLRPWCSGKTTVNEMAPDGADNAYTFVCLIVRYCDALVSASWTFWRTESILTFW